MIISAYADIGLNCHRMRATMKEVAHLFKAFSDETRLRILHLLLKGELCICELMEVLQLPQSNVSRHMAYLKNAGLVDDRREAVWVYYSLIEPRNKVHACQLKCLAECFDDYEILRGDKARLEEFKLRGSCASTRDRSEVAGQSEGIGG
jgi:ArsR family transcriptional regulator